MPHFSPPEMLIVLVIVVVLFGAGRIGKLGGELGTAMREFRKGLSADDSAKKNENAADNAVDSAVKPE